MLLSWIRSLASPEAGRPPRRAPHAPRKVRLEVEALEDRTVPSAIRDLPGFHANSLPPEDDAPSPQAQLGFTINFFGVQTNQVFVNNNGNITIGQPFSVFTPTALNSANGGIPIIAAYFADVDTRMAGNVTMYGTDTLCGLPVFGVDWFNVDYFDATSAGHIVKLSTFQLILIDRPDTGPGNFDIEFNYQTITWETGDASGGVNGLGGSSSRVGFSNGTGTRGTFFELPGSGIPGSFLDGGPRALISQEIAALTPGRDHFFVRNGQVTSSVNAQVGLDITHDIHRLNPFRFVLHRHRVFTGQLLLQRIAGPVNAANLTLFNPCLDEIETGIVQITFGPPVTVVFPNLPRGVTLANATGFTASGHPFISLPRSSFSQVGSRVRVPIALSNPRHVPLGTFYRDGVPFQVIVGPFDPTLF
jgi:hypothetical protein